MQWTKIFDPSEEKNYRVHPTIFFNRWCVRIRFATNCAGWRPAKQEQAHSDSSPAMRSMLARRTGWAGEIPMLYIIVRRSQTMKIRTKTALKIAKFCSSFSISSRPKTVPSEFKVQTKWKPAFFLTFPKKFELFWLSFKVI